MEQENKIEISKSEESREELENRVKEPTVEKRRDEKNAARKLSEDKE